MRQKSDLFTLDLFDSEEERGKTRSISKSTRKSKQIRKRGSHSLPRSNNFGKHYFYTSEISKL